MKPVRPCLIVTTQLGLERIAASKLKEEFNVEAKPLPFGHRGIVLVLCSEGDVEELAEAVSGRIVEAERVLPVYAETKANIDLICDAIRSVARERLRKGESFAVRTERRGSHTFTSLDVNVRAGACVQEATGSPVDLENPDKIFWVEILNDDTYICVTLGNIVWKKNYELKPASLKYLRKIVVGQTPYIAEPQVSYNIGIRIGRSIQSFEIKELVVTPYLPVDAQILSSFLKGILEGVDSRYEIQRKSYGRPVHRVEVKVFDLYQLVREYREKGIPIVSTSTKGRYIGEVASRLRNLFEVNKEVLILIGAREGLPSGILRFSDLVVDVLPGVTLATDIASTAILTAIANSLALDEKN